MGSLLLDTCVAKTEPHWGAALPGGKNGKALPACPYGSGALSGEMPWMQEGEGVVGAKPRVCPGFFGKVAANGEIRVNEIIGTFFPFADCNLGTGCVKMEKLRRSVFPTR